jgi:hypothetical protein
MTHTPHTHHPPAHGRGAEAAFEWLARQLRWEHLLDELRSPPPAAVEDEAA